MNKIWIYIKSIAIPLIVGGIVGFITSPFMDYGMLVKPFLAPPGITFPIVWTILYVLMGISYAILKSDGLLDDTANFVYYLQLGINALWSIFFFVLKWRLFAFFWIILLAVSVIWMIKEFYEREKIAGLLQIPYIIWIAFATYLNFGFYILNR